MIKRDRLENADMDSNQVVEAKDALLVLKKVLHLPF